MRSISISLSSKCIKEPKCKFCYIDENMENLLGYRLWEYIDKYGDEYPEATLALEYNGYGLTEFFRVANHFLKNEFTITTMPMCIDSTFCGAVASKGCKSISISYNSEIIKSDKDRLKWVESAQLVKKNNIHVSCNYLIEEVPTEIPLCVLTNIDQLNLLTLKPTGELKEEALDIIRLEIEKYKTFGIEVTTDNCLGVQLGYIDGCRRGEDFIHLLPNGEEEECCFKEDCFLYPDRVYEEEDCD